MAPALLAALLLADPPAATGDVTGVAVVRTLDQHPGAGTLWEPFLAVWKPRHLVCAFGAGVAGKTDMGDILACVSTDDGGTWGPAVAVFDHRQRHGSLQFAYANPVLFKPAGQDVLWCFAMRCPLSFQHSEDAQLVGAFSGDGGRAWTPVELAMHYTGPVIIVAGVYQTTDEKGHPRYLLPAHRNTRRNDPLGSRDQFVLSSTSLLEWRLAGHVPQPPSGRVFLHEGGLAAGDVPGELKLLMRTARYEAEGKALDPPRAFSSTSGDGGRTWTPARAEPDLHNAASKGFFGRSAGGTHLYVYSDGPAGRRTSLRYKLKPAGGAWGPERTFFDGGTKNSYPTLVEVGANDFRAVWDSGTPTRARTHIRFGRLKLAD